jgi:heptosyltransferase-2
MNNPGFTLLTRIFIENTIDSMKIIVRMPNWIGDSILAIPALSDLAKSLPEAKIWLACHERVADLFSGTDLIEDIVVIRDQASLRGIKRSSKDLREYGFDVGLLFTNSFSSALLFYKAGIPQRWGYSRDLRNLFLTKSVPVKENEEPVHHVYYYLDLLRGLGLETHHPHLTLSVSSEEKNKARELYLSTHINDQRPIILLNPGAFYGSAKRWPAEKYAELARMLQEGRNAHILITGSKNEIDIAESISDSLQAPAVILSGKTSLRGFAALMSQSSLLVTNDTGPMHMANALGVPVVALFGPTDPRSTKPFQEPSLYIKKEAPCWPCSYRDCPFDHRCMNQITAEEVYRACQSFIP